MRPSSSPSSWGNPRILRGLFGGSFSFYSKKCDNCMVLIALTGPDSGILQVTEALVLSLVILCHINIAAEERLTINIDNLHCLFHCATFVS